MALAKLYRVTDADGQDWLIAAPSFKSAERKFIRWESNTESSYEPITGLEAFGYELILGGTREDSIGNYQDIPSPPPPNRWSDSNQMASAGKALLVELLSSREQWVATPELVAKMDALRDAIDTYENIPF